VRYALTCKETFDLENDFLLKEVKDPEKNIKLRW
jgi:hypothetical protein